MPILDLSKMTKDELLRLADKIKIPVKKSMLKGEILAVLKRETKKAAKSAERKKANAKAVKKVSKKAPARSKKVAAKNPQQNAKPKKAAKPKTATALVKKKTATEKTTSAQKSKPIVDKAKAHKTPLKSVPAKKVNKPAKRKKPVIQPALPSSSKQKGRTGYDIQSLHPKFELEDTAQEAKFILGKPDIRDEARAEISPELPLGYGDNKIVMLVRDPHWCYLYWELQEGNIENGLQRLSRSRNEVRHVLRVHPAKREATPFDVDVDFRHRSHYLKLAPGVSYYAEIGLLDHEGYFAALAVSNTVTLPLDGPSEIIDEQWITTDENFSEIYFLSGGELPGAGKTGKAFGQGGSVDLQQAAKEPLNMSGVGSFGSAQIQEPRQEMNFSYWLDAELILYGGADLGATIELAGKKLDLRPDGTFTARFGLPEGDLELPVTFVSPDRSRIHTVTPNIQHTKVKAGGSDQ
jgi:hypothetical protein